MSKIDLSITTHTISFSTVRTSPMRKSALHTDSQEATDQLIQN